MSDKRTVLVVDDEPNLCEILKKALGREGYKVLTASSGRKALALLNKEKIDLLLLDLKMPDLGGLDVLKDLRKQKSKKAFTPAVILTAYGSLSSAREAMALGAIDYLTKPFDLKEVITLVKEALGEG